MSISRNTSYNLIGALLPVLLSFLTVPLYLALIGAERYGILAIAWLLLGYFGLFDLGLTKATAQRIAAQNRASPEARASTFWSAIVANLATGTAGGLVLYLIADFAFALLKVDEALRGEIIASAPVLAATIPVATVGSVLGGALQGRERFLEVNLVSTISTVLTQVLPIAAAWALGPNLTGLVAAALVGRLIAIAVLAVRCHVNITRHVRARVAKSEIISLLSFGGWVTVSSFVGPFMIILDRFVIGALLGAVAVTIYTVPFQLAQRLMLIPASLQLALFPRQSAAEPEEQKKLTATGVRAVAAINTPIVLAVIFCLEPFLRIWIGGDFYQEAAQVGRIIALGVWATGMATIPFAQVEARRQARTGAIVHLLELPFYLVGLFALMRFFGLEGAAVAFSLRCAIDAVIFSRIAHRDNTDMTMMAVMAALLTASAVVAATATPLGMAWAMAGGAFMTAGLILSWVYAPPPLRERLVGGAERAKAWLTLFRRSPGERHR